jgi:hypothetical protein
MIMLARISLASAALNAFNLAVATRPDIAEIKRPICIA